MEKIIYENELGMKVEFKNSRPFILTKIDGIGGLNNEIIETRIPYQDGSSYHNSRLDPRIITLYGGIMAENKELKFAKRNELIKIFNPKFKGRLTYKNDYLERSIDCRVETAPVWDNSVRRIQEFMIQLYCNNPFFFDLEEEKKEIALWKGNFEFPLEILQEGIELGYRQDNLIVNIFNKGHVNCGMRVEFKATATVVNPLLFNVNTRQFIKVNITLKAGEKLIINTTFGNKTITLVKFNGIKENALHYIDYNSTFLQLDIGDNLLRYDAEEGLENLDVSIYFKRLYLGV